MLENAYYVYYNSTEETPSADAWHTKLKQCDEVLLQQIKDQCPENKTIIVVNAHAKLPPYWDIRLTQAFNNNGVANLTSCLNSQVHNLSPLYPEQQFSGDSLVLDNTLYLLQTPQVFLSHTLNPVAFAFRDRNHISFEQDIYIVNNLLIDMASKAQQVKGAPADDTGDQRPLPAHPLAELQFLLSNFKSPLYQLDYPSLNDKPNVLHIVMDWGGGVHKWVNDFIQNQPSYNHFVLSSEGEFFRYQHGEKFKLYWRATTGQAIQEFHLSKPIQATSVTHPEYQSLLNTVLNRWDIKCLVVSSLIGHSMDCLNTGLPTVRVLHDYFPQWPSLNAQLDQTRITSSDVDEALQKTQHEPFGQITLAQLQQWQQANNTLLNQPNTLIIAPDQSVPNNMVKLDASSCYEKTQIISHGINPIDAISYQADAQPFTVLVLGRISKPKGEDLLHSILESFENNSDFAFVLLGAGVRATHIKPADNITVIEDYQQQDLHKLVSKHNPQLALLTSITSETFSYTLSELQMLAVPVLATAVGAFNNRIEDGIDGFLLAPDANLFVKKIHALREQPEWLNKASMACKAHKQKQPQEIANSYSKLLQPFHLSVSKYPVDALLRPNPLAQIIQIKSQQKASLKRQISALQSNLDEKIQWAKNLNQQITHLENNLTLERQEKAHLLSTIKQQQSQFLAETNELKETIKQQQAALTETNKQIEHLNQKLSQFVSENNQLKQTIEDMLNSRSWRITKPLRSFTTYARHKRNAIKFRLKQISGLPKRIKNSLKTRGLKQTAKLAASKIKKTKVEQQTIHAQTVNEQFMPLSINTSKKPLVSIIIPIYNQYKHTHHCLKSLAQLADKTPFEVIVIDDCSTDDSAQQLKNISGITAHTQTQNGGFIESCNTGANMAVGQFLLFLNNDTEVLPGWLDQLVATFDDFPDAGLVGSQLVYPDGRLQEAGGIVFADASGWNYGRFDSPDAPEYQHVREVTYCSGASILIKKQLFDQLGHFDTRYKPAYYEDTDLAFAVREAGKKVYYQPFSKVIHFEGISSGTDLTTGTKKYQVINQQKFLTKWQKALEQQPQADTDIELCRFQNQPKRVLIFDACTPTPDQDSGSLRMSHLMEIFIELGYQVSFIPENMAHFDHYTRALQHKGVECIYAPKYNSPIEFLKHKGKYFDLIILSRYYVASPLMPSIRSYCPNAKLWFDTVDLHYLRELRMAEIANDSQQIKMANKTKTQELAVAQACDLTLVVSPYEQEVLKQEAPSLKVDVLSNIHEVFGSQINYKNRKDILFIGGYQHTPNVDGILWFVEHIFPLVLEQLPHINLHIVGSKAPQKIIDLGNHPNIEFHGFVEDINPMMQNIRIAVAPLRFGAGVKGKVNMSMSHGQPVVGTKVAVEGMYTTHEKDVMMADDESEFATAVIKLYQNEQLWNQISQGGLDNVKKWFSFDAAKSQILSMLQK